MASSAAWWYATELQAVQKIAEQHSQDLKMVESTLCGLQRRMTQNTNSLAQRVEALERRPAKGKGIHETGMKLAKGCHKDKLIGHVDALAASHADLEARFDLFSSKTAAKMASCATALAELQEQTRDGPSILTDSGLQACIQNASSHVLRLEKLSEKWTELQRVQGCSGSADQFLETTGDTATPRRKEPSPEANGGHRLHCPQSGEDSGPCLVLPQSTSSRPAVLTLHSTPVTLLSPLLPCSCALTALRFPAGSCSMKQEL